MNYSHVLRPMKNFAFRFSCFLIVAGSQAAFAELPAAPIRETEQKQAHIQGETRLLAEVLDAMLGEYGRNNLAGDDAAAVRRVRESLGSLSSTEMRQVVDLLQRARAATNPDTAVKTVADAFTAQKQIVVAIQRILAEHAREQEAAEISRQLHGLADRQARNFQNGIELGRMMGGVQAENADAVQQAQLETQRGEQAAIAEEVKMIRSKLVRFAANPENAGAAENFKAAAKELERVEPVAATAADSLRAGQLFKAATDEKASRDDLRKVARQIAPREQGPEALRKAERELAEVIAEQRQIRDSTSQQRKQADFEKWLADKLAANDRNDALPQRLRNQPASALRQNAEVRSRFENEQRENGAQLAKLEDQQGELAGKTDALAQNIAEVPQASAGLKNATGKMQEARAAMQDANAPQAAQQQDAALAQLAAAHAELKRRADEAEALAGKNGDKVKDLEQLQKIAGALAREEAAAAKEPKPDAAAQADIARRANQLAQRAATSAPKAAPPAQAAADNARQGEQAMQAGKPAEGRAAAEQAAQNFAEAAKQIAQELAKAQAEQQQAAAAQAALADLAKLIQAEQTLDLETSKAAALASQKMPAPFADITTRQGAVQKDTVDFKGTMSATIPAASLAVGDAATAMGDARVQLDATKGAEARVAEQKAIKNLLAAQNALAAMLEQAQAALGQPMNANNAAQMAAANQLAQAQQQVQQAQANLQQAAQQSAQGSPQPAAASMQQAAQQLAQAAQSAGQAAAQSGAQSSPSAQQAMQQATQQLSSATGQAMSGQNSAAQQAAQSAAQSLAQAQAAMAAQQAGLSPSQSGAPMPGAQGQPGQGQGTQPGQGQGPGKSSQAATGPSQGAESYTPGDPKAVERGAREAALKKADFIGLPARERAAIEQSLREKYPQEYGALVEQYLLNLANESAKK